MNSGIPTASGYEERVTFDEIEIVDRNANDQGLLMHVPEGNLINGWDVNVCAVRQISLKRHVRYHTHAVRFKSSPTHWSILTSPGILNTVEKIGTARCGCCSQIR